MNKLDWSKYIALLISIAQSKWTFGGKALLSIENR